MVNSFFQWMFGVLLAAFHPFFVSMTDIKHNATEQTLEVSVRIFTDDFEQTLKKNCNCKIDVIKPADKVVVDQLIAQYVTKHLVITADGKKLALTYVGYEIQEGSVWSYYEAKQLKSVKQISIQNSLLHDYKDQQVNMIQVKANGNSKTVKLDYPNTSTSINL